MNLHYTTMQLRCLKVVRTQKWLQKYGEYWPKKIHIFMFTKLESSKKVICILIRINYHKFSSSKNRSTEKLGQNNQVWSKHGYSYHVAGLSFIQIVLFNNFRIRVTTKYGHIIHRIYHSLSFIRLIVAIKSYFWTIKVYFKEYHKNMK